MLKEDDVDLEPNIEQYAERFVCGFNFPKRIILKLLGKKKEPNKVHRLACIKHDIRYKLGGTRYDKLRADVALLVDLYQDASDNQSYFVRKRKEMTASMFFRLVRIFGFFTFKWREHKLPISDLKKLLKTDTVK